MGTRTTKENFLETVADEGPKLFSQLGFYYRQPAVFWRKLGAVEHGFFLTADPTPTQFHVSVGAHVPGLEERFDYIDGEPLTSLVVSRPLGLLRKDGKGERTIYYFSTVEQMRGVFPKVYADFLEEAEPWLETLVTVDDVAREFHRWRIAPPSPGETRPPDPFAWAQYGWLLQEAGNRLEAQPWLERALDQLREPAFYMKGGAFVPIGTKGARPVPRLPEELRLIELLRSDLGVNDE